MDATTIWDFIKKNGGAGVAIVLLYLNTGKLETRLDKVENALFRCYESKEVSQCVKYRQDVLAIIPDRIKIKSDAKNTHS